MNLIKNIFLIFFITFLLWLFIDLSTTKVFGIRGFSKFFEHNQIAGRINKKNFSGSFGGPLHDFYSTVNIGEYSQRINSVLNCENKKKSILFLGDSTTAGFEVNDSDTFVSKVSEDCNKSNVFGYNLGVRANDTHSTIGSYQRIKKVIPHTDVFYLITQNDYNENLDINAYHNMTAHFGRIFDGQLINFPKSRLKSNYLKLRIFINDNFYLSSQASIYFSSMLWKIKNKKKDQSVPKNIDDDKTKFLKEISKMNDLLQSLSFSVMDQGAKLAVGIYPCHNSQCNKEYAKKLREHVNANTNIEYVPIQEITSMLIDKGCFKLQDIRFKRDGHLSKFGHIVISEILKKYYLEGQNYNKNIICN